MNLIKNINNKYCCKAVFVILLLSNKCFSQATLVINGNFENYINCPGVVGINSMPNNWYFACREYFNSISYANKCATLTNPNVSVPYSIAGYQIPHSGDGYLLNDYLFRDPGALQSKLKDSLVKGKLYYCEWFEVLAEWSRIACNNHGMLFTKTAVYPDTFSSPCPPLNIPPQVLPYGNPIISDTMNWVKISGIYKAQGGEQFITLGNQFNTANTKYIQSYPTASLYAAKYFIDDVSVTPLDSFCLQADAGRDTTIKPNDSVFIGSYTNGIDTIKWYNASGQVIDSVQPGFWVKPTTTTTYYLQQMVNGCFTKDTVTVTVKPLPLQFISFSISPSFGGVRGGWSTANEINVSHFNILRSTNAKDFEKVGTVKALNNSYNEYSFIDELKPNTQYPTQLYYRIESIDKDGRKQHSAIKTVTINHSSLNVTIYPNPTKDIVNIYSKEGIKEVKLINTLGQIVKQQMFSNPVNSLPWRVGEAKGLYFVQVETKNGGLFNEKLLIE